VRASASPPPEPVVEAPAAPAAAGAAGEAPSAPASSRWRPRTALQLVLAAGALAAAIGSIIGVGGTVGGWLKGAPPGVVDSMKLVQVHSLRYGDWRRHEGGTNAGVAPSELRTRGKMLGYHIETHGFDAQDALPVRMIVHDLTHDRIRVIEGNPVLGTGATKCTCFDWVAIPRGRTRYYVEIAMYQPGAGPGEEPIESVHTKVFSGSSP
jgi:hypothetical protein